MFSIWFRKRLPSNGGNSKRWLVGQRWFVAIKNLDVRLMRSGRVIHNERDGFHMMVTVFLKKDNKLLGFL
ncbi:hypothetical protein ABR39_08055 [Enterobacter genomosp. O]|nr:hypothetical protein ABR39_08055 [Enterobacter genomosp. O]